MNLAQVLHQRWAAAEALNALLPVSRVFTGMSTDPVAPFAVISKRSGRPLASFSDGSGIDVVGVRIQVFHERYDSAAAIVEQVKTTFDRTAFPLAGSDRVLHVERTNEFEGQEKNGTWRMVIDLQCTVELAAGV